MRTAVVLAGGRSRRFGSDKADLAWGKTDLLHSILGKLQGICSELIVVANREWQAKIQGVKLVADLIPQQGPLSGIHAGLSASRNPYAFITACDMPFISPAAVEYLFSLANGYDAVIPQGTGGQEPLFAVYHRNCIQPIETLLRQEQRKVQTLFCQVNTLYVDIEKFRRYDPELKLFRNINTPAEYEKAREFADEFSGS